MPPAINDIVQATTNNLFKKNCKEIRMDLKENGMRKFKMDLTAQG